MALSTMVDLSYTRPPWWCLTKDTRKSDLGKCPLIIGFTWLHKHNPDINWRTGNIEFTWCPSECNIAKAKKRRAKAFKYKASIEEDVDEDNEFDDYTWEELVRQAIKHLEKKKEEEIREVKKEEEKKLPQKWFSHSSTFI